MTYTPEQLREMADDLEKVMVRGNTSSVYPSWPELARAHADALEELARVKAAQIAPVKEGPLRDLGAWLTAQLDEDKWPTAEKYLNAAEAALAECRAKLEVDPRTKYDGIDCRDETIRMLEKELEESARLHGMGASREAALQARLAESERKCERLKFHAEAMAHYTDCYKDKWPDSGARQALEEYRAEFKEES